MGLLNYTTKISVESSINEIRAILVAAGATAIMDEYDGARNITALSFKAPTQFGVVAFRLPIDVAAATLVLNKQATMRKIPKRYLNDTEQARRIGWRIMKDWLLAQLAIIEMGMVKLEQIFLPYAQNAHGETVYEYMAGTRFKDLALEDRK